MHGVDYDNMPIHHLCSVAVKVWCVEKIGWVICFVDKQTIKKLVIKLQLHRTGKEMFMCDKNMLC